MHVIARRTILFVNEEDRKEGNKTPRKHMVQHSKDPQTVPDWLRDQEAFKHAAQDDTIMEIELKSHVRVPTPAPAPALTAGESGKQLPAQTGKEEDDEEEEVDLDTLNKDQLQAYAKATFGLELDPKMKRDDMVAAIEEKATEPPATK